MEKISAKTDTSVLTTSLRSSFALSVPPRTYYYNYDAGECSDLVFGVSLVDYAAAREGQNNVPHIIKLCIEEVDKRGLGVEGIYAVSSLTKLVYHFSSRIEVVQAARTRARGQWSAFSLRLNYECAYSYNAKLNWKKSHFRSTQIRTSIQSPRFSRSAITFD